MQVGWMDVGECHQSECCRGDGSDRCFSAAYTVPSTDEVPMVVITMGCGDSCPIYRGKQYLDGPWTTLRASR